MDITETFIGLIVRSNKKFLQGQNVSGNFITKLRYYLQVWCMRKGSVEGEIKGEIKEKNDENSGH